MSSESTRPNEGAESSAAPGASKLLNLATKTLGGKQFWTDYVVDHGWRVQQHALTRHCRLLDDQDTRRGWGDIQSVWRSYLQTRDQTPLPAYSGKVFLTLHGLVRTRSSMRGLCRFVGEHGYDTIAMGYSSTRRSITDHAGALHSVLKHIRGDVEIYMAAHSLGNLVIRRYWRMRIEKGRQPDPRIRRIAMLAPPNRGARLANIFRNSRLFHTIWGISGVQIAEWADLEKQLATPTCEFGILAGGQVTRNPLLDGHDDWVVTVDETKLAGASDFHVLPAGHTFFMQDKNVREATLRYLEHGYFVGPGQQRPLTEQDLEP